MNASRGAMPQRATASATAEPGRHRERAGAQRDPRTIVPARLALLFSPGGGARLTPAQHRTTPERNSEILTT
ncbi:hypothetical protein GXW71_15530 [Roseomonas hellenica]|uniref:Uncharacterized protein n=1 Tax=Plastoroseomonas hellenica TaxID=2687306 RepID=A0ABS5EZP2_9PROT|nr:hypothetical protein [Plastoroseomonas hellenica]MBR0665769.1 hypothetical protein [Plastoroseomonas hellenica]